MVNCAINKIFLNSIKFRKRKIFNLFKPYERGKRNIKIARIIKVYHNYLNYKKNRNNNSLFDSYKFIRLNNYSLFFINYIIYHMLKKCYIINHIFNLYKLLKFIKNIKSIVDVSLVYSFLKSKILIHINEVKLKKNKNNKYKKYNLILSKTAEITTRIPLKAMLKKRLSFSSFFFFNSFFFYFIIKFINIVMKCGKKDKSITLFKKLIYNLLIIYPQKDPFFVIWIVFFNLKIVLFFKKKKVAGRVHHVPFFLNNTKQVLIGLKVFISVVRLVAGNGFINKLINEFILVFNKDIESNFVKKKKDIYNLAIENKYYVKFL